MGVRCDFSLNKEYLCFVCFSVKSNNDKYNRVWFSPLCNLAAIFAFCYMRTIRVSYINNNVFYILLCMFNRELAVNFDKLINVLDLKILVQFRF